MLSRKPWGTLKASQVRCPVSGASRSPLSTGTCLRSTSCVHPPHQPLYRGASAPHFAWTIPCLPSHMQCGLDTYLTQWFKKESVPWPVFLSNQSINPCTQGPLIPFPVQGMHRVASSITALGQVYAGGNKLLCLSHLDVSLFPSPPPFILPSLLLSLKIYGKIFSGQD